MSYIVAIKSNKIDVKVGNLSVYSGKRSIDNNEASFELFDEHEKIKILVNENRAFLKRTYDIYSYDECKEEFNLIPKSLFRGYWAVDREKDKYEIFNHVEGKVSVFKNGQQIAAISQRVVNILNTNQFVIHCDKSENIGLIVGIGLSFFGSFYQNESGNLINFNFGFIGFEKQKFDPTWTPKLA